MVASVAAARRAVTAARAPGSPGGTSASRRPAGRPSADRRGPVGELALVVLGDAEQHAQGEPHVVERAQPGLRVAGRQPDPAAVVRAASRARCGPPRPCPIAGPARCTGGTRPPPPRRRRRRRAAAWRAPGPRAAPAGRPCRVSRRGPRAGRPRPPRSFRAARGRLLRRAGAADQFRHLADQVPDDPGLGGGEPGGHPPRRAPEARHDFLRDLRGDGMVARAAHRSWLTVAHRP